MHDGPGDEVRQGAESKDDGISGGHFVMNQWSLQVFQLFEQGRIYRLNLAGDFRGEASQFHPVEVDDIFVFVKKCHGFYFIQVFSQVGSLSSHP